VAFVGTVGELPKLELTAVGDAVNVTARLGSVAGADEVLVTFVAARAAGLGEAGLERRDLELKGKGQPTPVLVLAP
jgi:class 3 adenylate cyclase